jgi:hypothetical protein
VETVATSAPQSITVNESPSRPLWRIVLICGAVAGVLSWIAGELSQGVFKAELVKQVLLTGTFDLPTLLTQNVADFKNAMLATALLGGIMGFMMGLAGGVAVGSKVRGLVVGLIAAVACGLIGAGAARGLLPHFYKRLAPDPNDLMTPILIHGGIWAALGAASAAAFAIGIKARREFFYIVVNATIAAFSASFLYHTAAEGLFPDAASSEPIAKFSSARLLAAAFVTMAAAVGAASGAKVRMPGADPKA